MYFLLVSNVNKYLPLIEYQTVSSRKSKLEDAMNSCLMKLGIFVFVLKDEKWKVKPDLYLISSNRIIIIDSTNFLNKLNTPYFGSKRCRKCMQ